MSFVNNDAGSNGGGLFIGASEVSSELDTNFSGNSAFGNGGAAYVYAGQEEPRACSSTPAALSRSWGNNAGVTEFP